MKRRIGLAIVSGLAVLALLLSAPIVASAQEEEVPQVNESEEIRTQVSNLESQNKTEEAMEILQKVLTTPKKYAAIKEWAMFELYMLAQQSGKVTDVQEAVKAALAKDPTDILLQISVAEGYVRQHNWAEVVKIYENLVKQKPDDNAFQTRLTDYYILNRQFDKAIARLEPIVTKDPNDSYHSDILANAYAQADMQDKAIALYKKKLEQNPNTPGLHGTYAQVLMNLGMNNEALKEWQKAFELDNTNLFFQQRVVETYEKLGNSKQAEIERKKLTQAEGELKAEEARRKAAAAKQATVTAPTTETTSKKGKKK
jgi:predicted Zn-dependent protease